mmetsp:Transcript_14731/g.28343  ORF Transcript_14731/g.28343 Transcript_14731/m.28343 type:complete len:203 (+) Transcript_14731:3-611(+)
MIPLVALVPVFASGGRRVRVGGVQLLAHNHQVALARVVRVLLLVGGAVVLCGGSLVVGDGQRVVAIVKSIRVLLLAQPAPIPNIATIPNSVSAVVVCVLPAHLIFLHDCLLHRGQVVQERALGIHLRLALALQLQGQHVLQGVRHNARRNGVGAVFPIIPQVLRLLRALALSQHHGAHVLLDHLACLGRLRSAGMRGLGPAD